MTSQPKLMHWITQEQVAELWDHHHSTRSLSKALSDLSCKGRSGTGRSTRLCKRHDWFHCQILPRTRSIPQHPCKGRTLKIWGTSTKYKKWRISNMKPISNMGHKVRSGHAPLLWHVRNGIEEHWYSCSTLHAKHIRIHFYDLALVLMYDSIHQPWKFVLDWTSPCFGLLGGRDTIKMAKSTSELATVCIVTVLALAAISLCEIVLK